MIEVENFQAGTYVQNGEDRCFVPSRINAKWSWKSPEIGCLLESATLKLGELNGLSRMVPDMGLFIYFLAKPEAVSSSRIEGTQTALDEAVLPEAEVPHEYRDDWREVQNYVAALKEAQDSPLPVSSRLLKNAHKKLMQGVRGKNKAPGEYRKIQNFLGATPASAVFIPPPASQVEALMSDLENFLHNDKIHLSALIRIAVAHYQFETVHPFLDGNGRIGRLMIPLYLADKKIMELPLLYMSGYLERDKLAYYDNLTRVREQNDMVRWLKFFLTGVAAAAEGAARALTDALRLKEAATEKIHAVFKRSGKPLVVLDELFRNPLIGTKDVVRECRITPAAARAILHKMRDMKLLREVTGRKRNRLFLFQPYLDIFEQRQAADE